MSVSPGNGKPLLTHLTFTPKTYEIDFSGVLSNLVHVKWLEDLRLAMLSQYLPLPDLMKNDLVPMITRTEIQYKSPIRLFDNVSGSAWLTSLGRTSWELSAAFVIVEQNRIAAEVTQQGLFINMKTQKPVRVPEALTTLFQLAFGNHSAERPTSSCAEEP